MARPRAQGAEGRLLSPQIEGAETDWNTALNLVAQRFVDTIDEHGPDSVAFYVSGQLMTEDYYVANKLMKGYIGSANIDTNSRLCMASSVVGHRKAFGTDTVPGTYEDLELADLVVLVGSNLAWCHPVTYQRLKAAKESRPGMKVVVVDPRRTATCEIADLHLPIAPDGDVALFLGLLNQIEVDRPYVEAHTSGLSEALALAAQVDLSATGLSETQLSEFFDLWTSTEKVVTVYSQGVNQSVTGSDKVSAILNCHLATGRIGKPGMGPFSVTGQPNAMGGREVGGLANMLASHLNIENPAHRDLVQRFWASPTMAEKPGLRAVDMFQAVADGRIKAIWVMATNPVVSMPEADLVKQALATCPFVVVSDVLAETDTAATANVKLPAYGWAEKDGLVTNSERRISRQRALVVAEGDARPDWWIICEVAKRMGWAEAFDFDTPASIIREFAASSGFGPETRRDFDISALADVSEAEFDALEPFQWPWPAGEEAKETRFFAEGRFYHADQRAKLIPVAAPAIEVAENFPLTLNTGRIRDQWHTMTRTGRAAKLNQHLAEPFIEIHPEDARKHDLYPAELAMVHNFRGAATLWVLVTDHVQPGHIFAPMHWTAQVSSNGRINPLVEAKTDPFSAQPAFKNVPVQIARVPYDLYGFYISRTEPDCTSAEYWAKAKCAGGWRAELAGNLATFGPERTPALGVQANDGSGSFAWFDGDALEAALFLSPIPVAVARTWAVGLLGQSFKTQAEKMAVLAGRPAADQPNPGAIVCACNNVGINQICAALKPGMSVDQLANASNAGTGCGTCRTVLSDLIRNQEEPKHAAA